MNVVLVKPDLLCPVPTNNSIGYRTDLQSNLNSSRKDKFILVMDIPKILKTYLRNDSRYCNNLNLDKLQLTIWGHVVPEIKSTKLEAKIFGQTFKTSSLSRDSYPTITVNYTIDNKFDNYYVLYEWFNLQNNEDTSSFNGKNLGSGKEKGVTSDYSTTIVVYALDEYDKPMIEWQYYFAFVNSVGGINASSRDGGENESTFSFDFSLLKVKRSSEFNN